jgi:aminopeptidase
LDRLSPISQTRLITCTPLAENMPSGHATKPGDVVYAMNGKSIEVDNTDAEGRLVLADALYYLSSVYNPTTLIDSATLTGATVIALGETYSAAYVSDDGLWEALEKAGKREADPLWVSTRATAA